MTVDRNGKVFIGFTTNPHYDYGTHYVGSGTQMYQFDVHSVKNVSVSWEVSMRYDSPVGYGYFVTEMAVDGDNNVHLFTTRYGWTMETPRNGLEMQQLALGGPKHKSAPL